MNDIFDRNTNRHVGCRCVGQWCCDADGERHERLACARSRIVPHQAGSGTFAQAFAVVVRLNLVCVCFFR